MHCWLDLMDRVSRILRSNVALEKGKAPLAMRFLVEDGGRALWRLGGSMGGGCGGAGLLLMLSRNTVCVVEIAQVESSAKVLR